MPWKFICNLWFHEVLQTTIIMIVFVKLHETKGRKQTSMALNI